MTSAPIAKKPKLGKAKLGASKDAFDRLRRRKVGIGPISLRRQSLVEIAMSARTAGMGLLGGIMGAYFLDPDNGRRRRAIARDRAAGLLKRAFRRGADRTEVAARMAYDHAVGAAHEARRTVEDERPAANDQELEDRVQTEIFRPADVPKGSVSVNAEMGVVYLRGEVKRPEEINALVARANQVEGVRAVENLLHTPGEPAPMKHETEPETRRRVFAARRG